MRFKLIGLGIIIFALIMGFHPGNKDDVMMAWIFGIIGAFLILFVKGKRA